MAGLNLRLQSLHSRRFQLVWAAWTLILGISLLFAHTIHYVRSFSEYLNAFVILDMPSSWCPTFLILFGIATLAAILVSNPSIKKVFTAISRFAGLVLLPVGIYVLYTFTLETPFSFEIFDYIYPQLIHVSELLTGLFTIHLLARPGSKPENPEK